MARALIEIARTADRTIELTAQTLPEPNASNAILRKLGFQFLGPVEVPEDGTVWVWRLALILGEEERRTKSVLVSGQRRARGKRGLQIAAMSGGSSPFHRALARRPYPLPSLQAAASCRFCLSESLCASSAARRRYQSFVIIGQAGEPHRGMVGEFCDDRKAAAHRFDVAAQR